MMIIKMLQQTGHATYGPSWHAGVARVGRLLSRAFGER
jgi:hypothetical protein